MNRNDAALVLHPMHQALLAHHPKEFHVGSMQVAHMTGTQGAWVILIVIFLIIGAVIAGILRHD